MFLPKHALHIAAHWDTAK